MIDRRPTETLQLFQHDRVAEGYALARPYLHPAVFERARALMGTPGVFARALDVGCGTGLSTVALRALAEHVVGMDASTEMLRRATREEGVAYVAAAAEALPFGAEAFDLVVACGAMDWIDRPQFMPQAASIIPSGGWLVSLDFGDARCSSGIPGHAAWYRDVFLEAFPCPPASDPMITASESARYGFEAPLHLEFTLDTPLSASAYAAFLMTESSVVAQVEYGTQDAGDVRRWLDGELGCLFGGGTRAVTFGGYVQAVRRQ